MIRLLGDGVEYRQLRHRSWLNNTRYWLSEPLRHVTDVGDLIVSRTIEILSGAGKAVPTLIDMGCGSCWLLDRLQASGVQFNYLGIDANELFIESAKERFSAVSHAEFLLADIDSPLRLDGDADLVVNAFNFFESSDLKAAMANASDWLGPSGTLMMWTIDKTFLMLALSSGWDEFMTNLRAYRDHGDRDVQYDYQRIDLGDGLSEELEYPSVLYSTADFVRCAKNAGLRLERYEEKAFTHRAVPKIYCQLEFLKSASSGRPDTASV